MHKGKWTAEEMEQFLLDPPTQATHDPAVDSVYINEEDDTYVYLRGNEIFGDGVPLDDYTPPVQDPALQEDGGDSGETLPASDIPPPAPGAPASRDVVMGTVDDASRVLATKGASATGPTESGATAPTERTQGGDSASAGTSTRRLCLGNNSNAECALIPSQ